MVYCFAVGGTDRTGESRSTDIQMMLGKERDRSIDR